jgi:hypothetical protein
VNAGVLGVLGRGKIEGDEERLSPAGARIGTAEALLRIGCGGAEEDCGSA